MMLEEIFTDRPMAILHYTYIPASLGKPSKKVANMCFRPNQISKFLGLSLSNASLVIPSFPSYLPKIV